MAHFRILPLCAALLLATACSQPGLKASQPVATETHAQQPAEAEADLAAEEAARAEAALPKQPLTPDILFKFLVAEVAGQRGEIGVAESTYLDLARQTQDPRIARRAAEVALFARDQAGALEATRLWAAGEQDSVRAQQTLAALLLNEGKLTEAEPILRTLLKDDSANGFLHLGALMGKSRDPQAALEMVQRLAADYPALPEARFAVAQAAASAGRFEVAVEALQQADSTAPRLGACRAVARANTRQNLARGGDGLPARLSGGAPGRARGAAGLCTRAWSTPASSPRRAPNSPA